MPYQTENSHYLWKLYIPSIVLSLLLILHIIKLISNGETNQVLALFVFLLLLFGVILFNKKRAVRLLKQADPERIIQNYSRKSSLIPDMDVLLASISANVYILYGRFDKAWDILENTEWLKQPPVLRAQEYLISAILKMVQKREYAQGIADLDKAALLMRVNEKFPGKESSKQSLWVFRHIGKLLLDHSQESLNILKQLRETNPYLMLYVYWALATYYTDTGNEIKKHAYAGLIQKHGPFCEGITIH